MTGHLDDLLAARLAEGSLTASAERAAADHAAACPDCADLLASHRALLGALDGLPLPEVPLGFTQGVLDRVDRHARQAARDRRAALAVGAAALAALAVAAAIGGVHLWSHSASRLAEQLGAVASALHLGAGVLPSLLGSLRLPAAAACALLACPLLLALPRLAAARGKAP
jgi:hypothetical protein